MGALLAFGGELFIGKYILYLRLPGGTCQQQSPVSMMTQNAPS